MRLVRLEFKAFGPFTGLELDFDGESPGLHLVFGANEAGKSSALRGLTALLFGFPQQTSDNFLHSYDQLLVAGRLRHSSGEEIFLQRRKRRIGDLLDEQGELLDPQQLMPFLQGLDGPLFSSFYGIDHETLVRGGEEILAQKGEVGQALFAAGAGMISVQEVLRELEAEATGLFLPAGQKPLVNASLRRVRELQQHIKDVALNVGVWKEQRRLLEEAELARTNAEGERDALRIELQRLERLHRAAPELAALGVWREQLSGLAEVPILAEDFTARLELAVNGQRDSEQALQRAGERLARLGERRSRVSVNEGLLTAAPVVDGLYRRLGEYLKGQKDIPERNGMRVALRGEAGQMLQLVRADLGLEEVEALRPMLVRKRAIQTLAGNFAALGASLAAAEEERQRLAEETRCLAEAVAILPAEVDFSALRRAVKLAHAAGDIDGRLGAGRGEFLRLQEVCLGAISRQRLWAGELSALRTLPLPLSQTVHGYVTAVAEAEERQRELDKAARTIDSEERRVKAELRVLHQSGVVPSEEDLVKVRGQRDRGWGLVKLRLEASVDPAAEEVYGNGRSLVAAYEEGVADADSLADRLRREADRVAAAAALRVRLDDLELARADHGTQLHVLDQARQQLLQAWIKVWQPSSIKPLTPREMLEWLSMIEQVRFQLVELAKKEEVGRREADHLTELRQQLGLTLNSLGLQVPDNPGLAAVLVVAEEALQRSEEGAQQRAALLEMSTKAARDETRAGQAVQKARGDLATWREQWLSLLSGLGRGADLLPLEAIEVMDALQGCFDKLRQAEELQKRIDGIHRDAATLRDEVGLLARQVAPDLFDQPVEQSIPALRRLLDRAAKEATLAKELDQEIAAVSEEIATCQGGLQRAAEQLAQLLLEARCPGRADLPEAIRRSALRRELQEKLLAGTERLAMLCPGIDEAQLAREIAEIDVDHLPGLVEQLDLQIRERLDPEINRLSQVIGRQQSLLAAMDGDGRAARLLEEMEGELARLRRLSHRYAQVKVAERVLRRAIDRYREEHQSPVVSLASDYFRRLTLGAFVGLRADSDENGKPVLVGVRPGEQRLGVARMSSGSRDQLYLALRLATLVRRARSGEPMPLFLDDILINFDDPRSRATLELLAELSATTQIILFTHHRRIVEEATTLDGRGGVTVHHLATA